jgi:hypothetical protein
MCRATYVRRAAHVVVVYMCSVHLMHVYTGDGFQMRNRHRSIIGLSSLRRAVVVDIIVTASLPCSI